MSDSVVQVRGLRKRYGAVTAVDGIDLDISPGEIFSLLGPNGAGKTTSVEILNGFRDRDSGEVRVLGADPGAGGRAWRARIGIVWQGQTTASHSPVRATLRHYAGYYPGARDVDELLELVGLTEKASSPVLRLSGGQRRRFDVALGLLGRPELLFLDEPTTGFDPGARRRFWDLIRALAAEGTTILLTTHYLDEAEALADRVSVIAHGSVVASGTPATLGGRASAQARVSWSEHGERRETGTDEPTQVVRELADRFDGEVPELTVHRPTLEDVYLELIGDTGTAVEAEPAAVLS